MHIFFCTTTVRRFSLRIQVVLLDSYDARKLYMRVKILFLIYEFVLFSMPLLKGNSSEKGKKGIEDTKAQFSCKNFSSRFSFCLYSSFCTGNIAEVQCGEM